MGQKKPPIARITGSGIRSPDHVRVLSHEPVERLSVRFGDH